MEYRADIDGLRAIAVLAVVLFHAFPQLLPGGFIGVDLFFVISGFLISSIIIDKVRAHQFSLFTFYARRARRILPALLIVSSFVSVFSWLTLTRGEFMETSAQVEAGALFYSNFLLLHQTGYFDAAADTKLLLHLWSLSIEEQFYLVWPILLWIASRLKAKPLFVAALLCTASFACNIYYTRPGEMKSFYLPFSRGWELMAGGICAQLVQYQIISTHKTRSLLGYAGLILFIFGLTLITRSAAFPGWWALFPVLGGCLSILSGPTSFTNNYVLSNPILVRLGLLSYPLYLWHWPLLTFGRVLKGEELQLSERCLLIVASLLLALTTYLLIERPVRRGGLTTVLVLFTATIAVSMVGPMAGQISEWSPRMQEQDKIASYFENSLPQRHFFARLGIPAKYRFDCDFYDIPAMERGAATSRAVGQIAEDCTNRDAVRYKYAVFLWGDSHAQHLFFGLQQSLPPNWQTLIVASSGCAPSIDIIRTGEAWCNVSNRTALDAIERVKPDVVVVAQGEGHDARKVAGLAAALQTRGVKRVIFMGPVPRWKSNLSLLISRRLWPSPPLRTMIGIDEDSISSIKRFKQLFPQIQNVVYLDVQRLLCNDGGCITRLGDDYIKDIVTFDTSHLLPITSVYVAKNLLVPAIIAFDEPAAVRTSY